MKKVYEKSFFKIASLSRDDIAQLGYKNADKISDKDMEIIAKLLGDAYIINSFWVDLESVIDFHLNLDKEEK